MEDRRSVGASSCNSGDGTDQRVKSLMFMMMMMMIVLTIILYCTFRRISLLSFYIFLRVDLFLLLFLILGCGYQPERVQAGIYWLFYTLLASLPLLVSILFVYNFLGSLCLFLLCGDNSLVGGLILTKFEFCEQNFEKVLKY